MPEQARKLSEIMKEMSEMLLRNPGGVPSSEAAHVALFFANVAWNESVGLDHARDGYRKVWETIEADNPELWNEFRSNDINAMIDELVQYKQKHYPDDRRRILTCGIPDGKVRVEWLPPAAPGVDAHVRVCAEALSVPTTVYGAYSRLRGQRRSHEQVVVVPEDYTVRDRLMAQACDLCVAVWNGRSRGTRSTFEHARRLGKRVVVRTFGAAAG